LKSSADTLLASPDRATHPPGGPRGWLAAGELVTGKYRLERRLGKGAMGSVWAATHLALDTPVAIKFMALAEAPPAGGISDRPPDPSRSGDQSADRRARFEREAKAAAQIRSANVVQVFDYGVDRGVAFIVMELLEGEDLNKRLQREGRLPPVAAARLVQAIARALQRAHDVGLVHRDLKPANIFLAKEGDHEVPKVVDFGVVKTVRGAQKLASEDGSENTVEGTLIGTPSYMSPEQAMGRVDVDHRSDLWSFGVILFQVLTGMKPFSGGQLFEALVRICSDPIPRPSSIAPDLPSGADAFFERALERNVGKRFQSAREMERAFYALVARPATSIPPQSMHPGALARPLPPDPPQERAADEGSFLLPVPSRRRLWAGAVAGAMLIGVLAFFGLRRGGTASESHGGAPSVGAPSPLPSAADIPAFPLPVPPDSANAAATGPVPAPSRSAQRSGGVVPAAAPPRPPGAQPPRKPRRDLGY